MGLEDKYGIGMLTTNDRVAILEAKVSALEQKEDPKDKRIRILTEGLQLILSGSGTMYTGRQCARIARDTLKASE